MLFRSLLELLYNRKRQEQNLLESVKINRLEPSDLNILEDYIIFFEIKCDLLKRMNEGKEPTGGVKFVASCIL